jgi:hypothetical protein
MRLSFRCDLLPPKFPKLFNRSRAVPGIVIVRERKNLNFSLVNRLQHFDPLGQLCTPVNNDLVPHLRLLLDTLAVPEPANICEVCGDRIKFLEPLREPGHPRLVYQGQRDLQLTRRARRTGFSREGDVQNANSRLVL